MENNNVTNSYLEATQQMIEANINNLRFDKTEVSTITEVLSDTEYQVYNGKTKYRAISLGEEKYSENEQVYVQIKEGDYSLDKTIIGKYDVTKIEELGQLYANPFDRLLISQNILIKGIDTNGQVINNIDNTLDITISTTGLGQPIFMGTNVSVVTDIDYKQYPNVEYGLKITLSGEAGDIICTLSSKDFIGNIYNFTPNLKHKNLIALPKNIDLAKINEIKVEAYSIQDTTATEKVALIEGIEWDTITIYFGYDNQSDKFSSSTDKVFIDTNTGLQVYNARKSLSENFNIDLKKEYQINKGEIIKPPSQINGAYNEGYYLDNNTKLPVKKWHFYDYDDNSSNIIWKSSWQTTSIKTISDEEALNINMQPPEQNEVIELGANTTFLAYPLELDMGKSYEYRNCFGFFERNSRQYYNKADTESKENVGIEYNDLLYRHTVSSSNIAGYYHFKINLETENERMDSRDRVVGPIDSDYTDFKVTLTMVLQDGKRGEGLPKLRLDVHRDLNHSNNLTLYDWGRNYNFSKNELETDQIQQDLILRYYSKEATLKQEFNFNTSPIYSGYLTTESIGGHGNTYPAIVHIPYGALVWLGDIKNEITVTSEFPLEDTNPIPLTARLKFNYFIRNNAVYANDYFADRVGIYKVPNKHYNDTTTRHYFKNNSVQKIGITELYETPNDWGQYSQDFVIDYGYTYYIGLRPQFGGMNNVQNNVAWPYIYIDNFKLYTLEPKTLTTLYGSWVHENNVYGANNLPSLKDSEDKNITITPYWYQKAPNYEGEADGIGPWWKKIIKTPATETAAAVYETNWNLDINSYLTNKANETFKLVVKKEDETFISKDFILTNEGYSVARDTIESEGLIFTNSDDGIYLYDYTGNLYNNEGTNKSLAVTAKAGEADLMEENIIAWMIPKNSTMIQPPQPLTKNTSTSDGGNIVEYYWSHKPDIIYNEKPLLESFNEGLSATRYSEKLLSSYYIIEQNCSISNLTLNYSIKQVYQPNNMNNDILVYVFENETVEHPKYNVSKYTPRFISVNNAGAESSLGIDLISGNGYLGADNTEDIKLKATVYDTTGVPLEIQPTITWDTGGAPTEFYASYQNLKGDAGKQISANTIEISKNLPSYYQVIFKANTRAEEKTPTLSITDYPKIYSVKVGMEKDAKGYIEIKLDEFCDGSGAYLQNILYLIPDESNGPAFPTAYPYFISKNNELIIHYVYSCTKIEENSEAGDEDYVKNNGKRYKSKRVFKSYSFNSEVAAGTPKEVYGEFGTTGEKNDYTKVGDYCYKLGSHITEVYVRVNMPSPTKWGTTNYGAMPYINFIKKTGNSKKNFYINYLTNMDEPTATNNILTINKEINTPLIIKAFCNYQKENNTTIQLTQYYTIPYFPTNQKYDLDGDTKISYSTFGTDPTSTGKEYKVYRVASEGKENIDNFYMEATAINSQISTLDKKTTSNNTTVWTHKLNLPTIAPAEIEWGTLDIYVVNEWNTNGTPKKDKGQLVAKYPLVLYRNTYAFQEINNWNGASTVTNDSYIISPMVAAGIKNDNNQFTGVMMGTHSQFPATGLYGFQNGVATFGFKQDGSCFLGANEETGRIEFNPGNTGGELIIKAKVDLQGSAQRTFNHINANGGIETLDFTSDLNIKLNHSSANLLQIISKNSAIENGINSIPAATHTFNMGFLSNLSYKDAPYNSDEGNYYPSDKLYMSISNGPDKKCGMLLGIFNNSNRYIKGGGGASSFAKQNSAPLTLVNAQGNSNLYNQYYIEDYNNNETVYNNYSFITLYPDVIYLGVRAGYAQEQTVLPLKTGIIISRLAGGDDDIEIVINGQSASLKKLFTI